MTTRDNGHPAQSWDVYWRGTQENAAHQEGGPQDQVLEEYWTQLFRSREQSNSELKVLDLACGNGAVTGYAAGVLQKHASYCLDYSPSALSALQKRYPKALCAAADAARPPFADASFDIVASQFGAEYAGVECLVQAAELVAPGGVLAAVMHLHEGAIYAECLANLHAIEAIHECRIMPLARAAFNAGFDVNAKRGSVATFKQAEQAFTPAVRALEQIIEGSGQAIAAGLPSKLYGDIAHMYQRMSAYERSDIVTWLDGMEMQLQAYAGRMSSMLECALNETELEQLQSKLVSKQLQVTRCVKLEMGEKKEAAAWLLECHRP